MREPFKTPRRTFITSVAALGTSALLARVSAQEAGAPATPAARTTDWDDAWVAKLTGKEGLSFSGPAAVFDGEEAMLRALEEGRIRRGMVVVIRYEGPKGGPGMPEMLTPTSAIMGAGLGSHVAMITDGRFSGGSHGFIIGHVTPEAQEGGPIALVQDGDRITIDASTCTLRVDLSDEDLAARRTKWRPPATRVTEGVLAKYVRLVRSASEGCTTD